VEGLNQAVVHWETLSRLQQLLLAGGLTFGLGFIIFYFTPLGQRRLAFKCATLAIIFHAVLSGTMWEISPRFTSRSDSAKRIRIEPTRLKPRDDIDALRKLTAAPVPPEPLAALEPAGVPRRPPRPTEESARPLPSPSVRATDARPRDLARSALKLPESSPALAPPILSKPPSPPKGTLALEENVIRRAPRTAKAAESNEIPVERKTPLPEPSVARASIRSTFDLPVPAAASGLSPLPAADAPAPRAPGPIETQRNSTRDLALEQPTPARAPRTRDPESSMEATAPDLPQSRVAVAPMPARQAGAADPGVSLATLLADPGGAPDPAPGPAPDRSRMTRRDAVAGGAIDPELARSRAEKGRLERAERGGGSARTEAAVREGLDWLVRHQSADGGWDGDDFWRLCPAGDRCVGSANEKDADMGITGIALLAFLGAGHTHVDEGPYAESVRRGLNYLLRNQRTDGSLMGEERMYSHAIASLAVLEALLLSGDERIRPYATRAIEYILGAQDSKEGGWRYLPGQTGDMSVTGWVVLCLRHAEKARIKVPKRTLMDARRFVRSVSTGSEGGLAVYMPGKPASPAMTAEAMVCRQIFAGLLDADKPEESEAARRRVIARVADEGADFVLAAIRDRTRTEAERFEVYFLYYGTLALQQHGGASWKQWNDELVPHLLERQEKDGHRRGSWEPRGQFAPSGGRVFATAASVLCLESYYRFSSLAERPETPAR
jgi:hypothetical protein